jgi:4-hydroxy-tetrahydrodipicolinate synthase
MKLHGIIPPLVTPLRGRDELDVAGLERLVEHVLGGSVKGLFILGTTGEGPGLSHRLRREMIDRVCRQVKGRVPVLVGVTDTSFIESAELANYAALKGASAVVIAPPYYLPEAQPELQEYLDHFLPESPLPLFLYNIPALTKVQFEMETLKRALDEPRIVGFKDSSGDLAYFKNVAELAKQRPDWSLLAGPEEKLLETLQLGGHGGINGGANIFPALYVKLYNAFQEGKIAHAQELQKQIQRVSDSLYRIGKYSSSIIKGIKCALACRAICDDFMAEPFHRFRAEERELVKNRLTELEAELSKLNL